MILKKGILYILSLGSVFLLCFVSFLNAMSKNPSYTKEEYEEKLIEEYREEMENASSDSKREIKSTISNSYEVLKNSHYTEEDKNDSYLVTHNAYSMLNYQDEPITINGKVMPNIYKPSDYPGFNPRIILDKRFTLGERERIKKSLILGKIMLHSDLFRRQIREDIIRKGRYFYGAKPGDKDYDQYFFSSVYNTTGHVDDTLNNLLQYAAMLYIRKHNIKAVPFATGGPRNFSEDFLASKGKESDLQKKLNKSIRSNSYIRPGVVNLTYDGKAAQYGISALPVILVHEVTHAIGINHPKLERLYREYGLDKSTEFDFSYIATFSIINDIYSVLDFPSIPNICYRGDGEEWNQC